MKVIVLTNSFYFFEIFIIFSIGDYDARRVIERAELYRELETESAETAKLNSRIKAAIDYDKKK